MKKKSSRRNFIGKAAAAGGTVIAGARRAHAKTVKNIPETDLIRVGVIALGDNSHMNYSIWAPMINQTEPGKWPVGRTTRMLITHAWDSRSELAEAFAKKYKCEAVKNYYDMVDKVDGMIFAGFNECKWWPQLTKPYLEAGIPCFINRPFAYSMKDAHFMVDIAKKHNTPILCTDEREYIQQAIVARSKVEELLRQKRRILGAHSSNASGEWSQHGVHGLYFLLAVLGLDVETVGYQADGWWKEVTPTATLQSYGQLSLQYRGINIDGIGEQSQPFMVSQFQTWPRADITLRLYHSSGWWDIAHEHTTGDGGFNRHFYLFFPTILAIQRMFETREMQWSYDYILKKTRIFLAAFKSHLEHNGAMIPVDDLPDDWEAPSPYADWIDEAIFE
ncbi:Gfo/Idh/MocA family oxidoreductase [Candidatus Latescibacterota bacterium]